MVQITVALLRKVRTCGQDVCDNKDLRLFFVNVFISLQRAEHNEGMVSTLEEVALHQNSIEKIELLGQVCPNLKILYLQNNLISKIQNLHKLKVCTTVPESPSDI
jgi:Leucine-rich repeat (LRR) protein